MKGHDEVLVVFSLEPWDGVWRRNQHLIDGLLRTDPELRVVFVEPPRDPLHDILRRETPRRGSGLRLADAYQGRLTLLEPTKWLPRLGSGLVDDLLQRSVRQVLCRLGVRAGLLWINDPTWAQLVKRLGWPAMYDVTDDWLAAERTPRQHERLRANEEALLQLCTSVVVCSKDLLRSRGAVRPDTVLIPNGVDAERYLRPSDRPPDLPAGPSAVYVGTLHEDRLDVELTIRTAKALHRAGAWCVLVGPDALTAANSALLRGTDGIRVLGARPFETVPGYLQHAQALLVPHLENAFTESLDPLKLYEYQAVGVPIVSTAVAGFRDLAGEPNVTVAGADSFPDAVTTVVLAPRPACRSSRPLVPDWSLRVVAISEQIDRLRAIAPPLSPKLREPR